MRHHSVDETTRTLQRLREPGPVPRAVKERIWAVLAQEFDSTLGGTDSELSEVGVVDEPITTAMDEVEPKRWFGHMPKLGVGALAFGMVAVLGVSVWLVSNWTLSPPIGNDTTPSAPPSTEPDVPSERDVLALPVGLHPQTASEAEGYLFVLATREPYGRGGEPPQEIVTLLAYVVGEDGLVSPEPRWTRDLGDAPSHIIAGEGAVWVAHFRTGAVSRLHPESGETQATIVPELLNEFGEGPGARNFIPADLRAGFGSVWMTTARGAVAHIDPVANSVLGVIGLAPPHTRDLAVWVDGAWVTEDTIGVTRVDSTTHNTTTVSLAHRALKVAVDASGHVWVAGPESVTVIDASSLETLGSVDLDHPLAYLGTVGDSFGAVDTTGQFYGLQPNPPWKTREESVPIQGLSRAAAGPSGLWLIDQSARTVTLVRHLGPRS